MTHTYHITGMTCHNCKVSVEKNLENVHGVTEVAVDLEKQKATVEMTEHVPFSTMQDALPKKYTLSRTGNLFAEDSTSNEKTKLQQLKPLFLILSYIAATSILLNVRDWNTGQAMLHFMGLFFFLFSFFKLLDLNGFAASFSMYDPLAKKINLYGYIYPFVEIALGIMFFLHFEIEIALVITTVVLVITTIGVTRTLLSKKQIKCACLGTVLDLPMTEATFIENAIMIVMALTMILGWV